MESKKGGGGLLQGDGPEIFVVEDQRDRNVELHLEAWRQERAVGVVSAEERFGEGARFCVVAAREDFEAGHPGVAPRGARDAFFDDERRKLNGLFVVSGLAVEACDGEHRGEREVREQAEAAGHGVRRLGEAGARR